MKKTGTQLHSEHKFVGVLTPRSVETDYYNDQREKTAKLMKGRPRDNRSKLSDDQVRKVRLELKTKTVKQVASEMQMSYGAVYNIRVGLNYRSVPD